MRGKSHPAVDIAASEQSATAPRYFMDFITAIVKGRQGEGRVLSHTHHTQREAEHSQRTPGVPVKSGDRLPTQLPKRKENVSCIFHCRVKAIADKRSWLGKSTEVTPLLRLKHSVGFIQGRIWSIPADKVKRGNYSVWKT